MLAILNPLQNRRYWPRHEGRAAILITLVVLTVIPGVIPGVARAQPEQRGFTLALSTRVGSFASFQIDGDNVLEPAIAPLCFGIGGFVSARLAILGVASAVFFRYSPQGMRSDDSRLEARLTRSVFLGVAAQLWFGTSLMIEGGLGFTAIGSGPLEARINRGIGFPARLGWSFAKTSDGLLSVVWELAPSFFSRGETTLSSSMGLQWQWL